jgi:hypothetical protein
MMHFRSGVNLVGNNYFFDLIVYEEFSLPRAEGNYNFIYYGLRPAIHIK